MRMSMEDANKLRSMAKEKGLGPATLHECGEKGD